jgi:cytochrome c oxidase subunit 2
MNILFNHTIGSPRDYLDSGSYIMDGIVNLNDHITFYEILVLTVVIWMLTVVLSKGNNFGLRDLTHGSTLEIIWTLIPGVILILIALPSFRLLYLMDDLLEPSLSVKVIGFLQSGQKFVIPCTGNL